MDNMINPEELHIPSGDIRTGISFTKKEKRITSTDIEEIIIDNNVLQSCTETVVIDHPIINMKYNPISNNMFNNYNESKEPVIMDNQPIPEKNNKYSIFDLFWLINPKYSNKEDLQPGEAQLVTISFNIAFGNLRIVFYSIPNEAINRNVIFRTSLTELIIGTIYPSSIFKVLNITEGKYMCLEQLINNTGEEWQSNRPVCFIEKSNDIIRLEIAAPNKNQKYYYDFVGWQKAAFEHACQFSISQGWILTGQKKL